MTIDAHRLGEERSLALHQLIAERLPNEPELISQALERLARWRSNGTQSEHYAKRWQDLLTGEREHLIAAMTDPGELGRELRQATPFAGVVDPRIRWQIWREVRRRYEVG